MSLRSLFASALSSLTLLVAGTAAAATLTLAVADLPHMAPALVAEAEGFFTAEGLDLKVLHCVNGRRCLQHLLDGQAQLATVADLPLALASHAGMPFEVVVTMATTRDHRLVVRADRGIARMSDLKGKRIGFVRGTSVHYYIDTLLRLHDLDPSQVKLMPLEQTLEAQARWAKRSKLVPGQVVSDFLGMIREAPLSAVRPRAVTVVK